MVDQCEKGCGYWIDSEECDKIQMHLDLWADRLEAHHGRFANLTEAIEKDARDLDDEMNDSDVPSHVRIAHALLRGILRIV